MVLIGDKGRGLLDLGSIEEIGTTTRDRLELAGFKSIKDLVVRGPVDVSDATGMEIEKTVNICNKARIILEDLGILDRSFVTATILYEKRKNAERISTGSENLDELFGGGIETNAITEIYGEYGTGKTQICHVLSTITSRSKSVGGLNAKVLYIDTENTFRPERIVSIAETRAMDPEGCLESIIVTCFNFSLAMLNFLKS